MNNAVFRFTAGVLTTYQVLYVKIITTSKIVPIDGSHIVQSERLDV